MATRVEIYESGKNIDNRILKPLGTITHKINKLHRLKISESRSGDVTTISVEDQTGNVVRGIAGQLQKQALNEDGVFDKYYNGHIHVRITRSREST